MQIFSDTTFVVECGGYIYHFRLVDMNVNLISGKPIDRAPPEFPKDRELNIYLILEDQRVYIKGLYRGRENGIYTFVVKDIHFDIRKHIRLNLSERDLLCRIEDLRCKIIDISTGGIKFKAPDLMWNKEKVATLKIYLNEKVYPFQGMVRKLPYGEDLYLMRIPPIDEKKVIAFLMDLLKENKPCGGD